MPDFDYDKFLNEVMGIPPRDIPMWVPCRSVEEAEAFAAWCVENDIEEPEIAELENQDLRLHGQLNALPIVDRSRVFVVDAGIPEADEWPDVIGE